MVFSFTCSFEQFFTLTGGIWIWLKRGKKTQCLRGTIKDFCEWFRVLFGGKIWSDVIICPWFRVQWQFASAQMLWLCNRWCYRTCWIGEIDSTGVLKVNFNYWPCWVLSVKVYWIYTAWIDVNFNIKNINCLSYSPIINLIRIHNLSIFLFLPLLNYFNHLVFYPNIKTKFYRNWNQQIWEKLKSLLLDEFNLKNRF